MHNGNSTTRTARDQLLITAQGVNYLLAPVNFGILLAFPRWRIWAAPAGFVTMSLALALSSFSTTTTELIISQGVFYGLGASVAYTPTIIFMDEWFARRKGLAFGIMWVSFLCSLHRGTSC